MEKARWQNLYNCSFSKKDALSILRELRETIANLDEYDLDYIREGGFFYKFKLSKIKNSRFHILGLRKSRK